MANQNKINMLSRALRLQVIEYLVKEDIFKFRGERLDDACMQMTIELIDRIPCCTRKLRELFNEAHRMHEDKCMMPHSVTVGDLEWCMKYYSIGYSCTQRIPLSWMPYHEDPALCRLPAFVELDKIYRHEHKAIAPIDQKSIENEATSIVNQISLELTRGF